MSQTSNLNVPLIDPAQTGKTVTMNTALTALDESVSDLLSVDASLHATPYTIPYSSPDEPTGTKTALRFLYLEVTGALSGDWTAYVPAGTKHLFIVKNSTSGGHNVIVKVTGLTGVTVASAKTVICYLNGTDVVAVTAAL